MPAPLTISDPTADPVPAPDPGPLATDELLVEEISIDGMCGVY